MRRPIGRRIRKAWTAERYRGVNLRLHRRGRRRGRARRGWRSRLRGRAEGSNPQRHDGGQDDAGKPSIHGSSFLSV